MNTGLLLTIIIGTTTLIMVVGGGAAVVYEAVKGTLPAPNRFEDIRNMFLIPGINEFIPVLWGIIALLIAVVVHEVGHAVMCAAQDIKIKSTGIVMFLIPIAAFVEPDEDVLFEKKNRDGTPAVINRIERLRVFASGVSANFIVAALSFFTFFILFRTLVPVHGYQGVFDIVSSIPHGILGFRLLSLARLIFIPLLGIIPNIGPNTGLSLSNMISITYFRPTVIQNFVFPLLSLSLWTGWINLMVGMFNSLPALPLDGGYVFRDVVGTFMGFFMKDCTKVERKAAVLTGIFTIGIFTSIIISACVQLILR